MRPGEKVRILREAAGLSQRELAERVNRSQAVLSQYEGGTRRMDPEQLEEIADALGQDPVVFYDRGLWEKVEIAYENAERIKADALVEAQMYLKRGVGVVTKLHNNPESEATTRFTRREFRRMATPEISGPQQYQAAFK